MSSSREDFDQLFSKFITQLKRKHDLVSLSASFTSSQCDLTLIKSALNLMNEWSDLDAVLGAQSAAKDDLLSEKYRNLGNPFYGKKQFSKALEYYNMCIRYALHPKHINITTKKVQCAQNNNNIAINKHENTMLSLGYANRSAVLFDLKLYELAHLDIERSFQNGYPNAKNKLIIRKVKCLANLSLHKWLKSTIIERLNSGTLSPLEVQNDCIKKANELLSETLSIFHDIQLSNAENYDLNAYIKSLIETFICNNYEKSLEKGSSNKEDATLPLSCTEHSTQLAESLISSSTLSEKRSISVPESCLPIPWYAAVQLPKLQAEDRSVRGLSAAVAVAYDVNKGRHLVALQDIRPGTVLAVDHGYKSGVVLPTYATSVCCTCLTYCVAPLPCSLCSLVVFCNEACRSAAMLSHHGRECGLLATMRSLDMGRNTELALRMVTNHDVGSLKKLLFACETGTSLSCPTVEESQEYAGCDPDGVYGSHDYRSIYHLVGNRSSRTVADLFKRSIMACVLLKLLKKHGYFQSCSGVGAEPGVPLLQVGEESVSTLSSGENENTQENVDILPSNSRSHDVEALQGCSFTRESQTSSKSDASADTVTNVLRSAATSVTASNDSACLVSKAVMPGVEDARNNLKPDVENTPEGLQLGVEAAKNDSEYDMKTAKNDLKTTKSELENTKSGLETRKNNVEADMVAVGTVLLRHMLNFPCNAHSVTLFHLDRQDSLNSRSEEVGTGAFGVLSLTNHSCSPNCYRQSYGGVGVLRAIEFIPKGAEVCDCYGAHFALEPRLDRQLALKKQYHFDCTCSACVQDWHGISCECRLCCEAYCNTCHPLCRDGVCDKSNDTLTFKLKCLRPGCNGIMSVSTNACSLCHEQYDSTYPVLRVIMSFNSASETEGNSPSQQATNLMKSNSKDSSQRPPRKTAANNGRLPENALSHCDEPSRPATNIEPMSSDDQIPLTVARVAGVMQDLVRGYDTACREVVEGRGSEGSEGAVERAVTALSVLVARPNKQLLKAQELLKHCYNRRGPRLVLPNGP